MVPARTAGLRLSLFVRRVADPPKMGQATATVRSARAWQGVASAAAVWCMRSICTRTHMHDECTRLAPDLPLVLGATRRSTDTTDTDSAA